MKTLALILGFFTAGSVFAADGGKSPYPLNTCVVSDEKLDSMGGPFVLTYQGQEVRLCCEHCKPKFEKDPSAYLKKIQDARK